jgi:hypothetical protein
MQIQALTRKLEDANAKLRSIRGEMGLVMEGGEHKGHAGGGGERTPHANGAKPLQLAASTARSGDKEEVEEVEDADKAARDSAALDFKSLLEQAVNRIQGR